MLAYCPTCSRRKTLLVRSSSPRLPSTPFDHRHQVRTSHSSLCSLPPPLSTGALYIASRVVVPLIGAINEVCPHHLSRSFHDFDRSTDSTRSTRSVSLDIGKTLRPMRYTPAYAVGVWYPRTLVLRAVRAPEKHAALRLLAPTACTPPQCRRATCRPLRRGRRRSIGCPRCIEQCTRITVAQAVVVERTAALSLCSE